MEIVRTYYTIQGVRKPLHLIIDDTLAQRIEAQETLIPYGSYQTIAECQNQFASIFGEEIFANAYPYMDWYGGEIAHNALTSFFPNAYVIPSDAIDSNAIEFTYGDNVFYTGKKTTNTYGTVNCFEITNDPYPAAGDSVSTPLGSVIGFNDNYPRELTIYISGVLKSSEYVNKRFVLTGTNVYRTIQIRLVGNTSGNYRMQVVGYPTRVRNWDYLNDTEIPDWPTTPTDPYETGGGSSTTGGGTGTFSETGDIVGIPGLPTLSAVDTGFITLFNPTAAQVKQLAAYMWSNSFDMATFKNIVANPIDCILGLTIVPVNPPDAGTKAVSVGNIATDVNMPYLSSQYVEVDCGTLNVQEFWGSYLDYSPYTKMSLYLPYIGIVPLDIDDVMNATITIKYHVDVLSGACVAYVLCNGTQLYTYIGQCSSNVPITSNDFTNTVNGILGIAGSIGSLVATGGASAPTEIGKIAGNAINALKPNIQKSGAMSGTGGLMGVQTPYLICQRPRQSVPASQNSFTGYPSNITATLSDLSGYTEVDKIHLEGVPCTNEEMDEIMTLLESGVYI